MKHNNQNEVGIDEEMTTLTSLQPPALSSTSNNEVQAEQLPNVNVSNKHASKRWLCVLCLTSGSIIILNIISNLVNNQNVVNQIISLIKTKNLNCSSCCDEN